MGFGDSTATSPFTDLTIDWITLENTGLERKMKVTDRRIRSLWRALLPKESVGTGVGWK